MVWTDTLQLVISAVVIMLACILFSREVLSLWYGQTRYSWLYRLW